MTGIEGTKEFENLARSCIVTFLHASHLFVYDFFVTILKLILPNSSVVLKIRPSGGSH